MKRRLVKLSVVVPLLGAACSSAPTEVEATTNGTATTEPTSGSTDPLPTDADPTGTTNPTDSTNPTDPTNATGPTDTTNTSPTTSLDSSSSGGTSCTLIDIDEVLIPAGPPTALWSSTMLSPALGDAGTPDRFQVELWPVAPDDIELGTIDLGAPPNDTYLDCTHCVRVFQDGQDGVKASTQFFQSEGFIELDAATDIDTGALVATFDEVVLVEVTIDPKTLDTVPVPDGACLRLGRYETAPNNSCADHCGGEADPALGSAPSCFCDDACDDRGDCCPDLCDPGVCDAQSECTQDTDVLTYGPEPDLPIPDDGYDGSIGSMVCRTFTIADDGVNVVSDVQVEIGMYHEYVGDLTMKVRSPEGTVVTLLSRPGTTEDADDGAGGGGDSSNLDADSPISFFDGGATDAELLGDGIPFGQAACLDDLLCDYSPNPGAAAPGALSSFVAENSVGTWRVCVADGAGNDTGFLRFVELVVEQTN